MNRLSLAGSGFLGTQVDVNAGPNPPPPSSTLKTLKSGKSLMLLIENTYGTIGYDKLQGLSGRCRIQLQSYVLH